MTKAKNFKPYWRKMWICNDCTFSDTASFHKCPMCGATSVRTSEELVTSEEEE